MRIDVYAKWQGQTHAEHEAQITGFSIAHGHAGYLREAYHGGPYATRVLMPEAFDESINCECPIPASVLRERLPAAIVAAIEREQKIYNNPKAAREAENGELPMVESLKAFVELCERKEKETGTAVTIVVSA